MTKYEDTENYCQRCGALEGDCNHVPARLCSVDDCLNDCYAQCEKCNRRICEEHDHGYQLDTQLDMLCPDCALPVSRGANEIERALDEMLFQQFIQQQMMANTRMYLEVLF